MATRRNDSKGYETGARGIDGRKGEGWQEDHRDKAAEAAMFGRNWWGVRGGGDITSPSVKSVGGHGAAELIARAKGKSGSR